MYKKVHYLVLFIILFTAGSYAQFAGGGGPSHEQKSDGFVSVTQQFSGTAETFFYSTTTYTFTDLVVFSYFDQSSYYVRDQLGNKIDSVTLDNNQYYVFSTGQGVFSVECTESFSVLVGDPVSRNVLGYYAVDESGRPLSTRLNTYMPANYYSGEHFIIFGYNDGTEFVIRNLATSTVIAAGVLNTGEHYQLDGYSNTFIGVEANKPVSALSYTDQGYFIPASNGTFAGDEFYGFAGYVGGWPNGIIVTGYDDSTHFKILNSETGDTLGIGTLAMGETFVYTSSGDTYFKVSTDKPVTVSNTPYAYYISSYYYLARQIDQSGLGIGTNFYAPVSGGQFDVFSFADTNNIMIKSMSDGAVVWTGNLDKNDHYSFSCSKEVYHVSSAKNVSVISSWGGKNGADFVPLNFALQLPDAAVSSNEISFFPEAETRTVGEKVTIKATVQNIGHETANQIWAGFYDGDPVAGKAISNVFTVGPLAPGASADIQFEWTVPEYAEYHNIYIQLDRWNHLRESNESNNIAFKSLIANNDLLPPLSTVISAPITVLVDDFGTPEFETFKVEADLFNTGTVTARNVRATIILPENLVLTGTAAETVAWDSVAAATQVDTSWAVKINSIPAASAIFYSILVEADSVAPKTIERMLSIKTPTAIANALENGKGPGSFSLSQNYPNPFNPTTNIKLELKHAAHVIVDVYDIAGRRVAQIADGMHSPGNYSYTVDGTDLVSGIYFLTLQLNGSKVAVRKMILVK